jgi:hypothetical protein
MASDPDTKPDELDSRKAQLSRIVAWTEPERPKPDEDAAREDSVDVPERGLAS